MPVSIPQPRYDAYINAVSDEPSLFNIYKRTTNQSTNKCVAIGFKREEAHKWIETILKTKERGETVVFYDVVEQSNGAAINPLWNDNSWIRDAYAAW